MKIVALLVALSMVGASVASAQSLPPITKSKAAAQKAVNATNDHTRRMTASPDSTADSTRRASNPRSTQASAGSTAVSSETASFLRESFRYSRSGRRDPFLSLMAYGELRPLITELRVTSIAYDPNGGSVAVLRDLGTKEQYRVRVGESLGRMRVARIAKKEITFTIEEFGYSRQETLALVDPKKESSQ